ncbi:hypothetical protein [Nocardiopsis halophila]|uniref:hypothetical protein n=1 Tax=Nocardiopsis halophila TaxID=141692 RepID=UPI001377B093|nr:hypothetical protein [Nocardiopsis halophila]
MDFKIEDVPEDDFYELEVDTESVLGDGESIETTTLSREEVDSVVHLEFTR